MALGTIFSAISLFGIFLAVVGVVLATFSSDFAFGTNQAWRDIDNARTTGFVAPYVMHSASHIFELVIFFSLIICALALAYGITYFDDLVSGALSLYQRGSVDAEIPITLKTALAGIQFNQFAILACALTFTVCILGGTRIKELHGPRIDRIASIAAGFTLLSLAALFAFAAFKFYIPVAFRTPALFQPFFESGVTIQLIDYFDLMCLMVIAAALPTLLTVALAITIYILLKLIVEAISEYVPFLDTLTFVFDSIEELLDNFNANLERHGIRIGPEELIWGLVAFLAGFMISAVVTIFAGRIGATLNPSEEVQVTIQVVLSNAIFDGLTLYVTTALLRWAGSSWRLRQAVYRYARATKNMKRGSKFEFDRLDGTIDGLINNRHSDGALTHIARYSFLARGLEPYLTFLKSTGFRNLEEADRWVYERIHGSHKRPGEFSGIIRAELNESNKVRYELLPDKSYAIEFLTGLRDSDPSLVRMVGDIRFEDLSVKTKNFLDESASSFGTALVVDPIATKHRPYIAGIVDVVSASLFAICALWFAFAGTSQAITPPELISTFFGGFNFSSGAFTNLGPKFWIMHTTFLPTLILWAWVLILFLAIFVVSPFSDFLGSLIGLARRSSDTVQIHTALIKTGNLIWTVGGIGGLIVYFS